MSEAMVEFAPEGYRGPVCRALEDGLITASEARRAASVSAAAMAEVGYRVDTYPSDPDGRPTSVRGWVPVDVIERAGIVGLASVGLFYEDDQ